MYNGQINTVGVMDKQVSEDVLKGALYIRNN